MKKIITLILVVTGIFALTGCKKDDKLVVAVWGGNEVEQESLNNVIKAYEEEYGQKVKLDVLEDYDKTLFTKVSAGDAPDVFYVNLSALDNYADQGVIKELDVSDFDISGDISQNLIDSFKVDGKLYAMAKDYSILSAIINKDMLKAYMTHVEAPKAGEAYTDAEMKAWAQANIFDKDLKDMYTNDETILGDIHTFLNGNNSFDKYEVALTGNAELSRNIMYVEAEGGSVYNTSNGKSNMADSKVVTALTPFLESIKNNEWHNTNSSFGSDWNGQSITTGRAFMVFEGNWVGGTLDNDGGGRDNFLTMPLPKYNNKNISMFFSAGFGISESISSDKEQAAKDFIKHFVSLDGQKTWAGPTGVLPVRTSAAEALNVDTNDFLGAFYSQINYASPERAGQQYATINTQYTNYNKSYFAGDDSNVDTVLKMLQKAQDEANKVIG